MLVEVAEAAMVQAEPETQQDDSTMAVDNVKVTDGVEFGHVVKKMVGEAGADGVRIGNPNKIDDHANTAIEDKAKSSVDAPMGRIELKQQSWSEAQGRRTVDNLHNELLQQMALLCASVQGLRGQMRDGFVDEGRRRQEDNEKLKDEMYEGFRNEEKARKLVQSELAVMKKEFQKEKDGEWKYRLV